MAGIPTLHFNNTSLDNLRWHLLFLLVRVQAEPLAQAFLPALQGLMPEWEAVDTQYRQLSDAVVLARAHTIVADAALNKLADQVSAIIHDGKKPDLDDPVHQLFFGNDTPSGFKKPTLGLQLKAQLT